MSAGEHSDRADVRAAIVRLAVLVVWPVPGFGQLNPGNPKTGEGEGQFGAPRAGTRRHAGIDIQAPVGTPVVAAGSGRVVDIRPNPSQTYGNQIVIDHGGGIFSHCAHLSTLAVKPGVTVGAGQRIGTVGRTGNVPPLAHSHLHFEIRIGSAKPLSAGGKVRNPLDYLPEPPSAGLIA